jgi:hypothetical protein
MCNPNPIAIVGALLSTSGYPLSFTATPNLTGSGYNLRPNVDPHCDKEVSGSAVDRLDRWFNTACFSVPSAGFVAADPSTDPSLRWKLGNATRTDPDLRADRVNNWKLRRGEDDADW